MTSRKLHHVLTTAVLAPALAAAGLFATGTQAEAATSTHSAQNTFKSPIKHGKFRVSQGFYRGHTGIDLAAPIGTKVHAMAQGRVVVVHKWNYSYGKHIVIQHSGARRTLYAHLSRIDVHKGEKVRRGEVIGRVGTTGNSTGPHLHVEVEKHGRDINPARFIK